MIELKRHVINLKTLDQDIDDSIVVGAGECNGRTLTVLLTQEAKARLTPSTLLYLSWKNTSSGIEGLDVFKQDKKNPCEWNIHYPQSMLTAGDVLACIKFIDKISISSTDNFRITVVADPNTEAGLECSENYQAFREAALDLNNLYAEGKTQIQKQQEIIKRQSDSFAAQKVEWLADLKKTINEMFADKLGALPAEDDNYIDLIMRLQQEQSNEIDEKVAAAADGALQLNIF